MSNISTITIRNKEYYIMSGRSPDSSRLIVLFDMNKKPVYSIAHNFGGLGIALNGSDFLFKNWDENFAIEEELLSSGYFENTGRTIFISNLHEEPNAPIWRRTRKDMTAFYEGFYDEWELDEALYKIGVPKGRDFY